MPDLLDIMQAFAENTNATLVHRVCTYLPLTLILSGKQLKTRKPCDQ